MPVDKVELGIDGCSVPNFAVPLYNAALGFARLCDPRSLPAERAAACRRITQSMMANPQMVAGRGRFDTRLMEALRAHRGQGRGGGLHGDGHPGGALGADHPGWDRLQGLGR